MGAKLAAYFKGRT